LLSVLSPESNLLSGPLNNWKADFQGFLNQPGLNMSPLKPPLPAYFGARYLTSAAKAVDGRRRDMQPARDFFHVHINGLNIHGYLTCQPFPTVILFFYCLIGSFFV